MKRTLTVDELNSLVKFVHGLNVLAKENKVALEGDIGLSLDTEAIPFVLDWNAQDGYTLDVIR